jgi:hypothetical protein
MSPIRKRSRHRAIQRNGMNCSSGQATILPFLRHIYIQTKAMKTPLLFTLLLLSGTGYSQYRLDAGIVAGVSNYLGDIGGGAGTRRDFVSDLKLAETKPCWGGFVRYKMNRNLYLSVSYHDVQIAGDDKLSSNPGRKARNLSFRNDIREFSIEGQYSLYTINDLFHTYRFRNSFRTYVGLGIAGFYHDPQALYQGNWVDLRPLRTEGEIQAYSKFGLAVPFTAGFSFTFNKSYRIGWEIGWRKTFTDYLDDVSGRYAQPTAVANPMAASLANRTGELHLPENTTLNYAPGNKRGDATHDDSYLFTTVSISYVFPGKSRWNQKRYTHNYRHSTVRHFRTKF